jgi:hypothetical protein
VTHPGSLAEVIELQTSGPAVPTETVRTWMIFAEVWQMPACNGCS